MTFAVILKDVMNIVGVFSWKSYDSDKNKSMWRQMDLKIHYC